MENENPFSGIKYSPKTGLYVWFGGKISVASGCFNTVCGNKSVDCMALLLREYNKEFPIGERISEENLNNHIPPIRLMFQSAESVDVLIKHLEAIKECMSKTNNDKVTEE